MSARRPSRPRTGRPAQPPWRQSPSMLAGLPQTRAEWLAIVLPAVDLARTHPQCATILADAGYRIDNARPSATVWSWYAWLSAEKEAGRLPEHPAPMPARTTGVQVGSAAIPILPADVLATVRASGPLTLADVVTAHGGTGDEAVRASVRRRVAGLVSDGVIRRLRDGRYKVVVKREVTT